MRGRIVYNHDFAATTAEKVSISTGNLTPGVYMLSMVIDGDLINRKIEVTK